MGAKDFWTSALFQQGSLGGTTGSNTRFSVWVQGLGLGVQGVYGRLPTLDFLQGSVSEL